MFLSCKALYGVIRTAVFIKNFFQFFLSYILVLIIIIFFKDSISIGTCRLKGPRRHPVLLSLADLGANTPHHS